MIGIMQGRLLPPSSEKIQEFHWQNWQIEFELAAQNGINLIEWNLINDKNKINPFFTHSGRNLINSVCIKNQIVIESITMENFLYAPIHRRNSFTKQQSKLGDLVKVIEIASTLKIGVGVLPLVKESGIDTINSLKVLLEFLVSLKNLCESRNFRIALECEFNLDLIHWLAQEVNNYSHLGFNFDIGNSASIGNDPLLELEIYGNKLFNVHVKDRLLNGKSVPLGEGNADFEVVFQELKKRKYSGNFILQAARQQINDEVDTIKNYIKYCSQFI